VLVDYLQTQLIYAYWTVRSTRQQWTYSLHSAPQSCVCSCTAALCSTERSLRTAALIPVRQALCLQARQDSPAAAWYPLWGPAVQQSSDRRSGGADSAKDSQHPNTPPIKRIPHQSLTPTVASRSHVTRVCRDRPTPVAQQSTRTSEPGDPSSHTIQTHDDNRRDRARSRQGLTGRLCVVIAAVLAGHLELDLC